MIVRILRRDGTLEHSALIAKSQTGEIATETGCFTIKVDESGDLIISVPGCDRLSITPTGKTQIALRQIKG